MIHRHANSPRPLLLLAVLAACSLAACGHKETPAAPPPSSPAATSVTVEQAVPEAPPPPAPATAPAPAAGEASDNSVGADLANTYLADLQSIVDSYYAVTKKKPADFSQLVSAGFLQALPPAPAGKRYTIEPGSMKVKISNR